MLYDIWYITIMNNIIAAYNVCKDAQESLEHCYHLRNELGIPFFLFSWNAIWNFMRDPTFHHGKRQLRRLLCAILVHYLNLWTFK